MNFRERINPIAARRRRYQAIHKLISLKPDQRILDLGCGVGNSFESFNTVNPIIGVDLAPESKIVQQNFRYVQADGTDLSIFKDNEFDAVVCIGVMEHISQGKRELMAHEIRRVGKAYAVVVPHYWTLFEPHCQLPLWQFYPTSIKGALIDNFNIGCYKKGCPPSLYYLPKNMWLNMFPDAKIISHNHIGGFIWNYIIFRSNST